MERARDCLNAGQGIDALDTTTGPHVIAALIKDWFRSLPVRSCAARACVCVCARAWADARRCGAQMGEAVLQHLTQAELANAVAPENIKRDETFNRLLNTDAVFKEPNRCVRHARATVTFATDA